MTDCILDIDLLVDLFEVCQYLWYYKNYVPPNFTLKIFCYTINDDVALYPPPPPPSFPSLQEGSSIAKDIKLSCLHVQTGI